MSDSIANPVTGERFEVLESTPEHLRFEYALEPGGFAVGYVDHVHPKQEERFEIEAGRLGVRLDGDEWTATHGTRFAVLPETPHTVWNDGPDEMRSKVEIRPPLGLERFFETMYGLAREGRTNRWGLPGPLQLAVIADAYREEMLVARVPAPVQRGLVRLVAPVGRSLGYRASYPRFRRDAPKRSR